MKYKLRLILASAVVASMLLTGCGTASNTKNTGSASETQITNSTTASSAEPVSQEIFAMDTYMTVTAYGDNAQKGVTDAVAEIQRLDNLLSIGKEDSEISKLNKSGCAAMSDDTAVMVTKALDLYKSTGGSCRSWSCGALRHRSITSRQRMKFSLRCSASVQTS